MTKESASLFSDMKINGPLAKDITRQIVCELYTDFAKEREGVSVFSLPGHSWKFEEHVLLTHYSNNLSGTELFCFENDIEKIRKNVWKGRDRLSNFGANVFYEDFGTKEQYLSLDLDSIHSENTNSCINFYYTLGSIDAHECTYEDFCWFDYCGNPSKDRLENFIMQKDLQTKDVQVFTFSTGWRREENVLPSVLEDSKTLGPAKAILKYFEDRIVNTPYKIIFNIEYVSNHTPMIIIAITNDEKILNDTKWQKYSIKPIQTEKKIKIKKVKNDYSLVYQDLRNKLDDKINIEKHKINKHQLGACKAWITMGK